MTESESPGVGSSQGSERPGYGAEFLAQHRRRYAALRLPPLASGLRDPDRIQRDYNDVRVEAAAAALELLDERGTPGLVPLDVCRALWRAGYRRLALAAGRPDRR